MPLWEMNSDSIMLNSYVQTLLNSKQSRYEESVGIPQKSFEVVPGVRAGQEGSGPAFLA